MGDGEKAPLRLQFNPKIRLNSTAQPSPQTLVFLLFESLMMPWALPKSLKGLPPGPPHWSQYPPPPGSSAAPVLSSVAWLATTTPTMPTV